MIGRAHRAERGAGVEMAVMFMLITVAFTGIILAAVSSASRLTANSARYLERKQLLDAMGEDFLRSPQFFDPANYSAWITGRKETGTDGITLYAYEKNDLTGLVDEFLARPLSFDGKLHKLGAYHYQSAVLYGGVCLYVRAAEGGEGGIALAETLTLTLVNRTDEAGNYVYGSDGLPLFDTGTWAWTEADGSAGAAHGPEGRAEWERAALRLQLSVSVDASGALSSWRYGEIVW